MKALDLLSFLNSRGRVLHPYSLFVVDDGAPQRQRANAYPVMRVDIDEAGQEILLVLRFPDEPARGAVKETVGEFLAVFSPAASDHPDFTVEASVSMRVMQFSRLDMPIVGGGTKDGQTVVFLLADGLDYLEDLVSA